MNKFSEKKSDSLEKKFKVHSSLCFILPAFTHLHAFTNPRRWVRGHCETWEEMQNFHLWDMGRSIFKKYLVSWVYISLILLLIYKTVKMKPKLIGLEIM